MTKTAATIPLTENDSNYYAGQAGPVPAVANQIYTFPELNTTLISNYDALGGAQVRDTGNFQVHGLFNSTDVPGPGNLIDADEVIVWDTTQNGIQIGTAGFPFNFVFIQLTDIARGDNWGSYSYLTLNEAIDNFLNIYVGEDQMIKSLQRKQVLFHARRAMQELSYDTLKAYKSQELTVPTGLSVPIPKDYVNYTRVAWADTSGVLHTIYPLNGLSGNPYELPVTDGATGIPSQSSYDTNLDASQSIIEDRWKKANQDDIVGNYDAYSAAGVFDYVWWKQAYGQRYGLDAEVSQTNGWFSINERTGKFSFSSNLVNKVIQLSYISDGLSYTLNSIVPKMVEEALYAQILNRVCMTRRDIDGASKGFFKRDSYVKTRNAKLRIQNLKLDEIVQTFRGQSKWLKH